LIRSREGSIYSRAIHCGRTFPRIYFHVAVDREIREKATDNSGHHPRAFRKNRQLFAINRCSSPAEREAAAKAPAD